MMTADREMSSHPHEVRRLGVLVGQRLEHVRLGPAVVLGFSGDRQVVIEAPARLGDDLVVEPGTDGSEVFASLTGEVVRTAFADATGELCLVFGSGTRLTVAADPDYESWAVAGPRGHLTICLARGELAFWGGDPV